MSTQQYSGSLISDLQATVDRIDRQKDAWELIADARTYLATSMFLPDPGVVFAPDYKDRLEAYLTLANIQDDLLFAEDSHVPHHHAHVQSERSSIHVVR